MFNILRIFLLTEALTGWLTFVGVNLAAKNKTETFQPIALNVQEVQHTFSRENAVHIHNYFINVAWFLTCTCTNKVFLNKFLKKVLNIIELHVGTETSNSKQDVLGL